MAADPWPSFAHVPPLSNDEVHVWQAPLDRDDAVVRRLETLLAADERDRADRFHFRRDRERYVVGRGLLRLLLGEYLGIGPEKVRLWYTSLGKPALVGDDDLRFNVAHSDALVLYAVSRGRDLGVDVERIRPGVEWRDLSARFFAPREVAELTALPPEVQEQAFFAGWTRKEAYLKALGSGLAVPLDRFVVSLAPDMPAVLLADDHDPAQIGHWQVWELSLQPGYAGALVIAGQCDRIVYRLWEPAG